MVRINHVSQEQDRPILPRVVGLPFNNEIPSQESSDWFDMWHPAELRSSILLHRVSGGEMLMFKDEKR
jgi:adenine-specific DNA methylase